MYQRLPKDSKNELIRKVFEGKKSVSEVCRQADISRTIFYRWLNAFKNARRVTPDKRRRFHRQAPPDKKQLVLDLAFNHPEYSSQKISQALGVNRKGKLILGNHGVYNVLMRHNLSTRQDRLALVKREKSLPQPLWNR